MLIDNVERRESYPRLTRDQVEDALAEERKADREAAYEHHINEACMAIQKTPIDLVTPAFIGQVLDVLGNKAIAAHMPEIGESIEVLSCEITP